MNKKAVEKETVKTIQGAIITVIVVLLFVSVTSNLWAGTRTVNPIENSLNSLHRAILSLEEGDSKTIYLDFGDHQDGVVRAYFGFNEGHQSIDILATPYSLNLENIRCGGGSNCICYCRLKLIGDPQNQEIGCYEGLRCLSIGNIKLFNSFMLDLSDFTIFGYSDDDFTKSRKVHVMKKNDLVDICFHENACFREPFTDEQRDRLIREVLDSMDEE